MHACCVRPDGGGGGGARVKGGRGGSWLECQGSCTAAQIRHYFVCRHVWVGLFRERFFFFVFFFRERFFFFFFVWSSVAARHTGVQSVAMIILYALSSEI